MKNRCVFLLFFILMLVCGCALKRPMPEHARFTAYRPAPLAQADPAPLFVMNSGKTHNRPGLPSAEYSKKGKVKIRIDFSQPAVYYEKRKFSLSGRTYTNHIYRIHFSGIPFSLIPFYLTTGNNVGLMVVITTDPSGNPLLVTTVHTCGCYLSILPTTFLSRDAYPRKWTNSSTKVYGERLPGRIDYKKRKNPILLIFIREDIHRVMDIKIADESMLSESGYRIVNTRRMDMKALESLPLNGETTSFYNTEGIRNGFVKGSLKGWESTFLSLISLDIFVGSDKKFGLKDEAGSPFYTSLKPWNRKRSDMRNFPRFLKFWGWNL